MDLIILQCASIFGGASTLAMSLRFYLRYRLKRNTLDTTARITSDALMADGVDGVEAIVPVINALVLNAELPVVKEGRKEAARPELKGRQTPRAP